MVALAGLQSMWLAEPQVTELVRVPPVVWAPRVCARGPGAEK